MGGASPELQKGSSAKTNNPLADPSTNTAAAIQFPNPIVPAIACKPTKILPLIQTKNPSTSQPAQISDNQNVPPVSRLTNQ
jgi:hypothetical protein